MYCPKCGTEIQDGTSFCPTCGTAVGGISTNDSDVSSGIDETSSATQFTSSATSAKTEKKSLNWKTWIGVGVVAVAVIIWIVAAATPNYISFVKTDSILEDEGYYETLETVLNKYVSRQKWSNSNEDGVSYVECEGLLTDLEFLLTVRVTDLDDNQAYLRVVGGSMDGYPQDGDTMSEVIRALYVAYDSDIGLLSEIDDFTRRFVAKRGGYAQW